VATWWVVKPYIARLAKALRIFTFEPFEPSPSRAKSSISSWEKTTLTGWSAVVTFSHHSSSYWTHSLMSEHRTWPVTQSDFFESSLVVMVAPLWRLRSVLGFQRLAAGAMVPHTTIETI